MSDRVCEWNPMEPGEYDAWSTECGGEIVFMSEGPAENSYIYCPYCGKVILVEDE